MKNTILMSLLLAGSMTVSSAAFAQEESSNTSTLKASDVQKKDEKVEDLDSEITNAKMRAESGSKSQWSMSFSLNYNGGNLPSPFGKVRPNYSGDPATNDETELSGDVGVAYRINKNNRINVGTGVSILTPLQNRAEDFTKLSKDGGKSEVSTPFISWGHAARIGETQNSFSLSYSHATREFDTETLKQIGAVSASHTLIFDVGNTNWQPGLSYSISNYVYSDGPQDKDVKGSRGARPDYLVGLYPFVEYAFNDKYSFRTVFRPFSYYHLRSEDSLKFHRSLYTQSMGLGIALTRDIYLYPNMQFAPENLKPELTNVGLSSTINMF